MSNTGWVVGDGKSIDIWNDPWLSCKEQKRPTGPAPELQLELKVDTLFLPHKTEWNREEIARILPFEEDRILSIKPSTTGAPDKLVWLGTTSGEYSTKSGYWKAMETRREAAPAPHHADFDWNKSIWNLHTAPKIKLFLWKIMNQAIPVGAQLTARNIAVDPKCKRCDNVESISHLLFYCEYAQKVWSLAPYTHCLDFRRLVDFASCWPTLSKLTCLPPSGIASGPLAPWILWAIWTSRNNLLFNNKEISPEETLTKALSAAREWLTVQTATASTPQIAIHPSYQPALNCITVNTDASWHSDRLVAGLGWIMDTGQNRASYMAHCYFVSSPLVAEALAIREAITLCIEKGFLRVHVKSDSLQLIKAITSGSSYPEAYGVLADICNISLAFECISFSWIRRENNKDADALAKQALLNEPFVVATLNIEA